MNSKTSKTKIATSDTLSSFSKAAIFRSVLYGTELCSVVLSHYNAKETEFRYEVIDEGFPCRAMVLCGGNPGMANSSHFTLESCKNRNGVFVVDIDGKAWSIKSAMRLSATIN